MRLVFCFTLILATTFGCQSTNDGNGEPEQAAVPTDEAPLASPTAPAVDKSRLPPEVDVAPAGKAIATFAGGCFWCVEKPFEVIDGVEAVYSGYTAGTELNPTYKLVASGQTSHTEAVRIIYDADKVTYDLLLEVLWRNIDPTQLNGQFVDHGTQYRTGIYYHDDAQKAVAEKSKAALESLGKFDKPIVVEILPASDFWPAEEYHHDFYKKSPEHYHPYRSGSGRDTYLEKIWGPAAGGYSLHQTEK